MMFRLAVFIVVLCSLIFPHIAEAACPFSRAEYIPDTKDFRLKSNYYYYTITITPGMRFILSLVDPLTKQTETRLKMNYTVDRDADPPAVLWLSRTEGVEVEFFNRDLVQVPVYSVTDQAPASMILRDSHAKFLTLEEGGLDIEYLSPKRVRPGATVDGHLELMPDVWMFNRCLSQ